MTEALPGGDMNRPTGTTLDRLFYPSDDALKRIRNWAMLLFALAALAMAAVTWKLVQDYFKSGDVTIWLVAALLADFALSFTFVVFTAYQSIRRTLKSGHVSRVPSPLYLRLLRHLALMALIPAIVTAIIGTSIIVVLGDRIFSEIRGPMENATNAAESYITSQYDRQSRHITALGRSVAQELNAAGSVTGGELRQALQIAHQSVSGLDHVFIIDPSGNIVSRGQNSFTFDCDTVAPEAIAVFRRGSSRSGRAAASTPCRMTRDIGEAVAFRCYREPDNGRRGCAGSGDEPASGAAVDAVVFRRVSSDKLYSLTRLAIADNLYVYGQTQINAEILDLYVASQVSGSDELISRLAVAVLQWSLTYVALLAVLLFLLLWVSSRIAHRVSRPVEELAVLADRVRDDDRYVRIPDFSGEDEIAKLGRSFKRMVERLVSRQTALERQYQEAEAEKIKFDSVLKTVSAGVIGLDAGGFVRFYNKAAGEMLQADFAAVGKKTALEEIAPGFFAELNDLLTGSRDGGEARKKVTFVRSRDTVELLVRVARWQGQSGTEDFSHGPERYVISIEDVTELTESERAKFSVDAARQVAHDLKSPLQAAKFGLANMESMLPEKYQRTISRQYLAVDRSLERVIDLVNRFKIPGVLGEVRPEPRDVVDLFTRMASDVQERHPDIRIAVTENSDAGLAARIDKRSMQDVFENLISNAVDSINERRQALNARGAAESEEYCGEIRISIRRAGKSAVMSVSDNGTGLPNMRIDFTAANVSTRGHGRGIGLTIAEAVVRKHKGSFRLQDAPIFEGSGHAGAQAVIQLPLCSAEDNVG